jgi:hypothetical protein
LDLLDIAYAIVLREDYCRYAIEAFWHRSAPCEFRLGSDQCVNVASNHDPKGHQNAKGKIIAVRGVCLQLSTHSILSQMERSDQVSDPSPKSRVDLKHPLKKVAFSGSAATACTDFTSPLIQRAIS